MGRPGAEPQHQGGIGHASAEPRYIVIPSTEGYVVLDREFREVLGGPFRLQGTAREAADELERAEFVAELVEVVRADGFRGLARELTEGLPLEVAIARLRDIDQGDSTSAEEIVSAIQTLARASENRLR